MKARLHRWIAGRIPTRESLEHNRWVRPFAHRVLRSELWHMNRRSIPRGVALGLFVGIMVPLAHFVVVLFVAMFVRANIPSALAATFIGFPVIYVGIVALAYRVGEWLLHVDALTGIQPLGEAMQHTQSDHLLQRITGAGLDTALGLFVIATVLSSLGYVLASVFWRLWIARKRRLRLAHALARHGAAASAGVPAG